MKERVLKAKNCKSCGTKFMPMRPFQMVCSSSCGWEYGVKMIEKKEKQEKTKTKKELMTKSDWIKLCQQVFNKYIRLRDKDNNCISCNNPLQGKYDAGHYFSCGAYPNLRFEELNTHGQCVRCNQHLHGNISEYSIRLPIRIGEKSFNQLISIRNKHQNYSIRELQELIKLYKQKIKDL